MGGGVLHGLGKAQQVAAPWSLALNDLGKPADSLLSKREYILRKACERNLSVAKD